MHLHNEILRSLRPLRYLRSLLMNLVGLLSYAAQFQQLIACCPSGLQA